MKVLNTLEDINNRIAKVKKWEKRFSKLKDKGLKTAAFCRKHGFYHSWISKAMKGTPLPSWGKIEQVEEALATEEKKNAKA